MEFSHRMDPLQTRNPDPKSIDQVLDAPSLKSILGRVKTLNILNQWLQQHLQAPLSYHCRVMNMEGNILTLGCDSGAWATRLKLEEFALMREMDMHPILKAVKRIQYKICV